MKLDRGRKLFVRSLINVCAEPIPFFWNMRNFIHHNPLYGLEHIPFEEAVVKGSKLFHARRSLPREQYIKLFREGHIEEKFLREEIAMFAEGKTLKDVHLEELLFKLSTEGENLYLDRNSYINCCCPEAEKLANSIAAGWNPEEEVRKLLKGIGRELTVYDTIDGLFGRDIARKLDELLIKVCAEFLDEGQSVWGMPDREEGLYRAWREIAIRNKRYRLKGCCGVGDVLRECEEPEEAVVFVLNALGVPEDMWEDYITLELSKLHGWTGYIRWRSDTKEYYWQRKHPADLTDYVAVRLLLSLSLMKEEEKRLPVGATLPELREFVESKSDEALIRWEFFRGECPPHITELVEEAIEDDKVWEIKERYVKEKLDSERLNQASFLLRTWENAGFERESLVRADGETLNGLASLLKEYEKEEGFIWLRAHERSVMKRLLTDIKVKKRDKTARPFAQALFCIDVRSERFRRNLEKVGDYETYGIAGFFGVPVSFIELGKGHETYLCPVLIKPKNVVLEMHKELKEEEESLGKVIKEILHDLKHNVLTPYITVEAIGLLFGFDMVGKTLFPLGYGRFRERLSEGKPPSKLIIDKPSKAYVLEVVGILQREIVRRALKDRFKLSVSEELAERLRKVALEEEEPDTHLLSELGVGEDKLSELVRVLREEYRVEKGYTRIQIEKLAKIGFTQEEQVFFVERALRSIGLTENFGKVVLIVGHGSKSDNNPYESALDCGACGGDHGAVNARVFASMVNKGGVRQRLRERGIDIPEDTIFIACEHNTTTDEIEFFDLDEVPATHLPFVQKIREDLKSAGLKTATERCEELEGTSCGEDKAFRLAKRNSMDWTQVRPEWGLSGNYAFIVGRRELTEELNLEGKVFLHSYNWEVDTKGMLLEIILSGPLVVGEWINMEHFFSVVDNKSYGSGSKVYHNVVSRLGVMSGNFSDLRTGLPAQTVLRGKEPHHKPIRLITLVEAPLDRVQLALKGVRKVRELVHNRWINLIVLDPLENRFYTYKEGEWKEFTTEEVKV